MSNDTSPEKVGTQDAPSVDRSHFEVLRQKYDGQEVSIYCINGARYKGSARVFPTWIEVAKDRRQSAICNMSHVIAITKA